VRGSKIIRLTLYSLGGILAGIILILIFLAFVPIRIDLSEYKGPVESAATLALGRTVTVDDKIRIITSLQPYFSLEGLRIANPKNFQMGDLLHMKEAMIGLRLLPLLKGKLHITEIRIKGLTVSLVEGEKGAVNWVFSDSAQAKPKAPRKPKPQPEKTDLKLESDSLVLARLILEDISVEYRRPGSEKLTQLRVEKCNGSMIPGEPFTLTMNGVFLKEPYTAKVEIASLKELIDENRSWMRINTEISQTRFEFSGAIDLNEVTKSLKLNATVAGDRLDSLNGLLSLNLPPLKSYRSTAKFILKEKRAELSDFQIRIGKSKLVGKMTVDNSGTKSKSIITLQAPLIQLDDFDVGDWSPKSIVSKKPTPENTKKRKEAVVGAKKGMSPHHTKVEDLLSPEVLGKFEVMMNMKADKILSGNDKLGSGSLTAILKDGRLSINPVNLNIPGGYFALAASLKPDIKAPEASVRTVITKFDFGVLVRRMNPKAKLGGFINLDVDLKSSSDSFRGLLAKSNGYFDFSGRLKNLKAGIIDLWAVNVIAAVLSREEEDASKINCLVGRWSMKDGMLKPDVFIIDTSKIRICGKGHVDFKKGLIDVKMAPTPKKAEYFSLATPIEVKGKLSDFGVGIQPGGLVGTAVKVLASPVTTTFERMFGRGLPADGNDVCAMPIGHENRPTDQPAGCK
jgi:AsmA family protein